MRPLQRQPAQVRELPEGRTVGQYSGAGRILTGVDDGCSALHGRREYRHSAHAARLRNLAAEMCGTGCISAQLCTGLHPSPPFPPPPCRAYGGQLAQLAVYDSALDAGQVLRLYNMVRRVPYGTCVRHWHDALLLRPWGIVCTRADVDNQGVLCTGPAADMWVRSHEVRAAAQQPLPVVT